MGDHLVLHVDRLIVPPEVETVHDGERLVSSSFVPVPRVSGSSKEESGAAEEEEPLIQLVECRICQDEDNMKNLKIPCACSGSLKPYKQGCTATPRPPDETTIDISGGWTISGAPIDFRDLCILAMVAVQRHILATAVFCFSAALNLIALLLLRYAVSIATQGDDVASTCSSLFLRTFVRYLLPCYIMAWAIINLHKRWQRQAAAAKAAAEVAFMLQSGQGRSVQFTIAPESSTTPQQEPHC